MIKQRIENIRDLMKEKIYMHIYVPSQIIIKVNM